MRDPTLQYLSYFYDSLGGKLHAITEMPVCYILNVPTHTEFLLLFELLNPSRTEKRWLKCYYLFLVLPSERHVDGSKMHSNENFLEMWLGSKKMFILSLHVEYNPENHIFQLFQYSRGRYFTLRIAQRVISQYISKH